MNRTAAHLQRTWGHLLDFIPSHIVTIIDGDKYSGSIYATDYSYKQTDPLRPSVRLLHNERELLPYKFFIDEFEDLWNAETSHQFSGGKSKTMPSGEGEVK